ncbi:MAG: UbiA family prenyltransferase [Nitrososphaera sp.]
MQPYVRQRLKEYLLLIRLPNVFTTPSNILAGYFAAITVAQADGLELISLMASSSSLYVAGIVLNDYFDIEIDRKERPFRPLPSGNISKRHALAIGIVAILAANIIAAMISLISLAVTVAISLTIIAYDYRLKQSVCGPFAMSGARFLNVILGASPALLYLNSHSYGILAVASTSLFVFVISITILSRKEVSNERPNSTIATLMVIGVILAVAASGLFLQLEWAFLLNLSIFAGVMFVTFKQHLTNEQQPSVQNAVRNMVLSIIILDSVFVSGTAGLLYGLSTLLLILPAVVLAKKLYVT